MMCQFIGWSTTDSDCSSWGNYDNVSSAVFDKLWHSGDASDIWMQETFSTSNFRAVVRGGFVNSDGNSYLATSRIGFYSASGNRDWHIGFRMVLYVK